MNIDIKDNYNKKFISKFYNKEYLDFSKIKKERIINLHNEKNKLLCQKNNLIKEKLNLINYKNKIVSNEINYFNNKLNLEYNSKNNNIENKEFIINHKLKNYTITLLGYKDKLWSGNYHTNYFPWNRFFDVFKTIGYKCEWVSIDNLVRKGEKRLFITWNKPTSLELYKSGKINKDDIIFQKLTSLGKGMDDVNWTKNSKAWCKEWRWPIYKTVEYLYDLGLNIYAFGCKTRTDEFPEKKRICEKLKDRIFWISWGGTPFDWNSIKNAKINVDNNKVISFVGSKWGKVGRGNIDSWEKYIKPLEKCKYNFQKYGGIGKKMVSDEEMIEILKTSKICPIIHCPSWQSEYGVQDRFYSVFLSGSFGICDNLGAIDIFGEEIRDICTEDPKEYYEKTIYYLNNPEKQFKYIDHIQNKIKTKFNFYIQWEKILLSEKINFKNNNQNIDLLTNSEYYFLPEINKKNIIYENENINNFFDKIFIINMKKNKDRKIKILEILEHYNITNYEFIEAVDGYDSKYDEFFENKKLETIWEKIHKTKHINKKGELGCLLSHLKILQLSKERKYKKWLHLEDDVIFHNNFNNLFKKYMNLVPESWDLIYFGSTQAFWRNNNLEYVNENIYKANISCGTFAFAVSNTNIDFIIDKFNMKKYPADGTIVSEIQNILNCYVIKPNLIVARLNDSTISKNRIVNITQEEKDFEKYGWIMKDYNINKLNLNKNIFSNDRIKREYNISCNNYTNNDEFKNYVKGKKIAIIGPAPSVKDEENGDFIESNYDIIIRINKQWKHSKKLNKYIGKNTDILYNCLDNREDCGGELDIDYLKDKVKFIVSTIKYDFYNKETRDTQFHGNHFLNWYNNFHINNKNRIKFIPMDNKLYDFYDEIADTRINTGLMAILHILEFDIKELYIKGFTFFLDGYLLDYRKNINGNICKNEKDTIDKVIDFMIISNKNHNQEKQWSLFKKVYNLKKSIIKLDPKLNEIVNLENFPKFNSND